MQKVEAQRAVRGVLQKVRAARRTCAKSVTEKDCVEIVQEDAEHAESQNPKSRPRCCKK